MLEGRLIVTTAFCSSNRASDVSIVRIRVAALDRLASEIKNKPLTVNRKPSIANLTFGVVTR